MLEISLLSSSPLSPVTASPVFLARELFDGDDLHSKNVRGDASHITAMTEPLGCQSKSSIEFYWEKKHNSCKVELLFIPTIVPKLRISLILLVKLLVTIINNVSGKFSQITTVKEPPECQSRSSIPQRCVNFDHHHHNSIVFFSSFSREVFDDEDLHSKKVIIQFPLIIAMAKFHLRLESSRAESTSLRGSSRA